MEAQEVMEIARRLVAAQARRYAFSARLLANWQARSQSAEYRQALGLIVPGTVVLDVGAYTGNFALGFSLAVGERGTVIAIEPQRSAFQELVKTTAAALNVRPIHAAASDHTGTATLGVPLDSHHGVARQRASLENHDAPTRTEVVDLVRLDDLLPSPVVISLIKIDVEGHERQVLTGAMNILQAQHPALVVEIEQRHLGRHTCVSDVVQPLLHLGYACRCIGRGGVLFPWEDFDVDQDQLRWVVDGDIPAEKRAFYGNNFVFTA